MPAGTAPPVRPVVAARNATGLPLARRSDRRDAQGTEEVPVLAWRVGLDLEPDGLPGRSARKPSPLSTEKCAKTSESSSPERRAPQPSSSLHQTHTPSTIRTAARSASAHGQHARYTDDLALQAAEETQRVGVADPVVVSQSVPEPTTSETKTSSVATANSPSCGPRPGRPSGGTRSTAWSRTSRSADGAAERASHRGRVVGSTEETEPNHIFLRTTKDSGAAAASAHDESPDGTCVPSGLLGRADRI